MTEEEVRSLLATPGKLVVRPFIWSIEASGHVPKTSIFESGVQAGKEVLEGVVVRARFRGPKLIEKGLASFTIPERFACALFVENDRVAALDTNPQQSHPNRVGAGRPFYGKTLLNPTHRHVWVGEYGYAEPRVVQPIGVSDDRRVDWGYIYQSYGKLADLKKATAQAVHNRVVVMEQGASADEFGRAATVLSEAARVVSYEDDKEFADLLMAA